MTEVKFTELDQAAAELTAFLAEVRPILTKIEQWPARIENMRALYQRGQQQADAVVRAATDEAARERREADRTIAAAEAEAKAAVATLDKQKALLASVAEELRQATADREAMRAASVKALEAMRTAAAAR